MLRKVKALFDLGRVSNLPTIWSNCLAAWLLAGAGFSAQESMAFNELGDIFGRLAFLFTMPLFYVFAAAASLLYLGGTALNDAFDASFDQKHRPERPIPSGIFSLQLVWVLGMSALLVGAGIFVAMGLSSGDNLLIAFTIALAGLILFYDWIHKRSVWAALPMGGCRLLLYVVVAFAAANVTHQFTLSRAQNFSEMTMGSVDRAALTPYQWISVLVVAGALFVYIVVLTLSARAESGGESLKVSRRVSLLLYLPVAASIAVLVVNNGDAPHYLATLVLATVFVVWTKSAITILHDTSRDLPRIGTAVGRLLAGICLIDAMATVAANTTFVPAVVCVGFFLFALLLQRFVPST